MNIMSGCYNEVNMSACPNGVYNLLEQPLIMFIFVVILTKPVKIFYSIRSYTYSYVHSCGQAGKGFFIALGSILLSPLDSAFV